MPEQPLTIDNLGIDASNKYARNQKELEGHILERLPGMTEAGVQRPYTPTEFEKNFMIGQPLPWAAFAPPPNYDAILPRLFSYLLIPSLGGTERLQTISDQLEKTEKKAAQDPVQQYEHKKIVSLIKTLIDMSRTFDLIKARCNQYQRG